MSADTVQITTDAAPVCGRTGAQHVAVRRAAIETINRGFDRFIILGAQGDSSVAGYTPGSVTRFGNTAVYSPGAPLVSHSQGIVVKMFRAGDPNGSNAIDARGTLGPKWQETVQESTRTTC